MKERIQQTPDSNAGDIDPKSEAVYLQALELQSHRDSYEDQAKAQRLFQSIYFYRDADRHANQCTFRAWEIRWDKRKKIAAKTIPAVLVLLVAAFVGYQVHQNAEKRQAEEHALAHKYSLAQGFADRGEYALAIDAFTELGDYGDSAQQAENARAALESNQIAGLQEAKAGDLVELGFFSDHDNGRYGSKWKVLARDDGKLLLITNTTVGIREYNDNADDVNWQNSTLRTWLNDEFFENAFTDSQKDLV